MRARLSAALDVLRAFDDVVLGRVTQAEAPAWAVLRGWERYLAGLDASDLEDAETHGARFFVHHTHAPDSLRELAKRTLDVTRLEPLGTRGGAVLDGAFAVKARKLRQIEALIEALRDLAASTARIVDVGTGAGHLSRLASECWVRDALGIDRDGRLLERASELAADGRAAYVAMDALHSPLPVSRADLVLGLHACGEVTDVALVAAAREGASMAFVSCCLQKVRSGSRPALSETGRVSGFSLTREVLGLSNLMTRAEGVEVPQARSLEGHEARHGLRRLLERRGIATGPGEEMRGINRRRARHGFERLVRDAFAARGLAPPTEGELVDGAALAREEFERMRRWSLPRACLARVVECAVAFDRARFLEEQGYVVAVREAFDASVSPRNVALVASRASLREAALSTFV